MAEILHEANIQVGKKFADLPEWVLKQQIEAGRSQMTVNEEEVDENKLREVAELMKALGEE